MSLAEPQIRQLTVHPATTTKPRSPPGLPRTPKTSGPDKRYAVAAAWR